MLKYYKIFAKNHLSFRPFPSKVLKVSWFIFDTFPLYCIWIETVFLWCFTWYEADSLENGNKSIFSDE